jgi:flagellar assembly protein FliH
MGKTNLFTDTNTTKPAAEPAPTRKFMFERSFDASAANRAPERKPVTLKPDQYDALKKESYDAGFAAGQKAGLDEQTTQMMLLLAKIEGKIDQMADTMDMIHKDNETNVRRIALAMLGKFVPDLNARHGLAEIEAMLGNVITEMVHEPRLVVRVHETQFDVLDEKINAITKQKAYAGKVVVLADAEIAPGDCRIEWADGGMERNAKSLMTTIEKTVTP